MKKSIVNKTSLISFSCFLLFTLILNNGCKKIVPEKSSEPSQITMNSFASIDDITRFDTILPLDQLIVWREPVCPPDLVRKWIRESITKKYDSLKGKGQGRVDTLRSCKNCDNSLMLLAGPGIKNYLEGGLASGGIKSTPVPPAGDSSRFYTSLNFRVTHKNNISSVTANALPSVISVKKVKVAVLDGGIDKFEKDNYLSPPSATCIPGGDGKRGWNFVANNDNFQDNGIVFLHGSTVTRFITDQDSIKLLPAKTHDAYGVSDLYTICCAFAYARHLGAKIINASFGFYLPQKVDDQNVVLLKKYIKHYLTNNKILLVAAAGNLDTANVNAAFRLYKLNPPVNPRNLDAVNFWPASLSRDTNDFWNVIAVTTVDTAGKKVSPMQNYSQNVVDIGVRADAVSTDQQLYVFNNPRLTGKQTVEGSSFATPIVTGKLCVNYDSISKVLNRNGSKDEILNAIKGIVTRNDLLNKIRAGRFMTRN